MHVGWGGGKRKLDRLSINMGGGSGGGKSRMAGPCFTAWPLPSGRHPEAPGSQGSCGSLEHT